MPNYINGCTPFFDELSPEVRRQLEISTIKKTNDLTILQKKRIADMGHVRPRQLGLMAKQDYLRQYAD